ncbi:MAG: C25 family cysteine peptidase [PVC group bacterium]
MKSVNRAALLTLLLAAGAGIYPAAFGQEGREYSRFSPRRQVEVPARGPETRLDQFLPHYNTVDYLIVVPDELKPAIEPLVEWKQKKGLRTRIIELSEIGDDPGFEEISASIKSLHEKSLTPITYLLLAGDAEDIPPHYRPDDTGKDLYYTDGLVVSDIFYGIMGDGPFPEIHVGRLPARTPEELEVMVQKILDYEKYPGNTGCDWFSRGLLFGTELEIGEYGPEDAQLLESALPGFTTIITTPSIYNPAPFFDEINQGVSVAGYYGHGSPWGMHILGYNYLEWLDNGSRLPLVISAGCSTGQFDLETHPYPNWTYPPGENGIGELLLKLPGRGGIGFIGPARSGGPGFKYGLFDGCYQELAESGKMGPVMDAGKIAMYEASVEEEGNPGIVTNEAIRRYDMENINLLGDPELPIYIRYPLPLEVSGSPPGYPLRAGKKWIPVAGATVCLRKQGNQFLVGKTDNEGRLKLSVPAGWDEFDVTVTARNFIPCEDKHVDGEGPGLFIGNTYTVWVGFIAGTLCRGLPPAIPLRTVPERPFPPALMAELLLIEPPPPLSFPPGPDPAPAERPAVPGR